MILATIYCATAPHVSPLEFKVICVVFVHILLSSSIQNWNYSPSMLHLCIQISFQLSYSTIDMEHKALYCIGVGCVFSYGVISNRSQVVWRGLFWIGEKMSRHVLCGNFEYETRKTNLELLLSKYGRVERVDMKPGIFIWSLFIEF